MKVFDINNGKLSEVLENPFKLEKDIQSITEENMNLIFGIDFVKSEFSLSNFRIDSLCYDKQNKSFIIIEYKNTKNFSVIDQGYSYLSLMLNNKADFILEYNEATNSNLRRNDVDWSQSRVIFISPTYTRYQKASINFKDLPIELWEIKKFKNNSIVYLPIKSNNSTESIKTISSNDTTINEVSKEVITYTEEEHLTGKPDSIVELYETLKNELLNLGDIALKANKQYIAFVGSKRNIVDIVIQKSKIRVFINLKYPEIEDYKQLVRDVTNIGSWGNGDCEVSYSSLDELDYLMSLIKQSYQKNG